MQQTLSPAQQSQRFDLPSGAILVVTVAPFKDAWTLMKASLKTLKGMELKPEDLRRDMASLADSPSVISVFLDRIVEFATSPEVESALWQCAQRALYIPAGSLVEFPGEHVSANLFDDPKFGNTAREDYARIIAGIMEVNCKPFLVNALSGFLKQKDKNPDDQKSKST